MKKTPLIWLASQMKRRIPAIGILVMADVCHALFGVFFALGSRGVIDAAVSGNLEAFYRACGYQAAIIGVILFCLTVKRHLNDRLRADLERDWKQRLLHGLLHGDYTAVSTYHSAELLNRLNNDVQKVNLLFLELKKIKDMCAMVNCWRWQRLWVLAWIGSVKMKI